MNVLHLLLLLAGAFCFALAMLGATAGSASSPPACSAGSWFP